MGTLTVLAPSFFTAGHTLGNISGHALELFTCAPSTRYGAPSTISALRPSRVTRFGRGESANAAAPVSIANVRQVHNRIVFSCRQTRRRIVLEVMAHID